MPFQSINNFYENKDEETPFYSHSSTWIIQ